MSAVSSVQPKTSELSEYIKVKQSDTSASARVVPPSPDKTKPDKHAFPPNTVTVVKTPDPAGIDEPVNEKPKTVEPPEETVNPASPAAPPLALISSAPSTLNWKPAISASLSYKTSNVNSVHVDPSPPQISHSSKTAEPPHSLLQSISARQFPSQSKFSCANSQSPVSP